MNLRNMRQGLGACVALVLAAPGVAGVVVEEKPVSLVTSNLAMHGGRPFVHLSELARALGGTGRYDPARQRYEIQPGPNGALLVNSGAVGALSSRLNTKGAPRVAGQNSVKLGFGGGDVEIDNSELVLLYPADPEISLAFLARLLGGQARFDPSKGSWVLPPGGPDTPLRFR